jgi:hypothetical protein
LSKDFGAVMGLRKLIPPIICCLVIINIFTANSWAGPKVCQKLVADTVSDTLTTSLPKQHQYYSNLRREFESRLKTSGLNKMQVKEFSDVLVYAQQATKDKEIIRLLNDVQRKGVPYRPLLTALYKFVFPIESLHKMAPVHREFFLDQDLRIMDEFMKRSAAQNYFILPTAEVLSIVDINIMTVHGFLPMGIVNKSTRADDRLYMPKDFFNHDLNHARLVLQAAGEKQFSYKKWLPVRQFLDLSAGMDRRTNYSNQVLIFSLFHEMGMPLAKLKPGQFEDYYEEDSPFNTWSYYTATNINDDQSPYRLKKSDFKRSVELLNKHLRK